MCISTKISELGYSLTLDGKLSKESRSGRVSYHSIQSLQNSLGADWVKFCLEYLEQFPISVKLAFGQDIHEVFENFRPGSCMRFTEKRDMREVYANNPDDVCCAYAEKGDHELLCSPFSAIVWTGAKRNYLDRIYSSGNAFSGAVDSFASAIASAMTAHNGKPVKSVYCEHAGLRKADKVTFTLKHDSSEPLPYMDCVNMITSYTSSTVTLSTDGCGECCQDQDGTFPNGDTNGRYRCENCSDRVTEDDVRTDDNGNCYCESCYDDLFGYCEWCEETCPQEDLSNVTIYASATRGGNYRGQNNIREMYISDDVLRNDFSRCVGDSCEWVHDDDKIELTNGDYISPADMEDGEYCELSDGTVCERNECVYCEDTEEYVLTEDAYQWSDGEYRSTEEIDEDEIDEIAENGITATPIVMIANADKSVEIFASASGFCVHKRLDGELYDISHHASGCSANIKAESLITAIKRLTIFANNLTPTALEYFATMKSFPQHVSLPSEILDGTLSARELALQVA